MAVIDPTVIRKAAALVAHLAELETKFGVLLNGDRGDIKFAIDGTVYGTGRDDDGELGLDLT